MLDKFYYLNNYGEKVVFGQDGIFAAYNDLRDYTWSYESTNDVITSFKRGVVTKKMPVLFLSQSGQETRQARNTVYEIFEKDVLAKQKGKLYVNGYYMECWIIGTTNSEYLTSECYLRTEFAIVTDKPEWRREATFSFVPTSSYIGDYDFDFDGDFPFDLQTSAYSANTLVNPFAFSSQFILSIYGACDNPSVEIGDYVYSFNCSLLSGERLEVNSLTKKITKYNAQGVSENYFNCRNKENSVFEPIASGNKQIYWNNEFSFDLTVIQQRSEPEWSYTAVSASDVSNVVTVNNKYYLMDSSGGYIKDNNDEPISVQTVGG